MTTRTVRRDELSQAASAVDNAPAQLGVPVLIEGLLLDAPARAQHCLAAFAYRQLASRPFRTRVGRRRDGDWAVEIAGEHDRWLSMRPVTRGCADIDEVRWDVAVRDSGGDPVPVPPGDGDDGTFVREHLGVDPGLVEDLVSIALATPGLDRHFRLAS